MDSDKDGSVTLEEWKTFWANVLKHGYSEEEAWRKTESVMHEVVLNGNVGHRKEKTGAGLKNVHRKLEMRKRKI